MVTESLRIVTTELRKRLGFIPSDGLQNCRPKRIDGVERPDLGYSEHAFGNAEDLAINGQAAQAKYINELDRMRNEGFPVGTVLHAGNRPNDHTDHIHLEGSPALSSGGRIPPCAGGPSISTIGDDTVTTGQSPTTFTNDDAPSFDLPVIGDIGPILFRVMWFIVAIVASVLAVRLIAQGYSGNLRSGTVAKGVVKVATKGVVG